MLRRFGKKTYNFVCLFVTNSACLSSFAQRFKQSGLRLNRIYSVVFSRNLSETKQMYCFRPLFVRFPFSLLSTSTMISCQFIKKLSKLFLVFLALLFTIADKEWLSQFEFSKGNLTVHQSEYVEYFKNLNDKKEIMFWRRIPRKYETGEPCRNCIFYPNGNFYNRNIEEFEAIRYEYELTGRILQHSSRPTKRSPHQMYIFCTQE